MLRRDGVSLPTIPWNPGTGLAWKDRPPTRRPQTATRTSTPPHRGPLSSLLHPFVWPAALPSTFVKEHLLPLSRPPFTLHPFLSTSPPPPGCDIAHPKSTLSILEDIPTTTQHNTSTSTSTPSGSACNHQFDPQIIRLAAYVALTSVPRTALSQQRLVYLRPLCCSSAATLCRSTPASYNNWIAETTPSPFSSRRRNMPSF